MIEMLLGAMIGNSIDYSAIKNCAKNVHPVTISAIIETESGFNPYAIGINSDSKKITQPTNFNEAVRVANELLAEGYSIDLGLGQINSNNLEWLNMSVEDTFEPCKNISAIDYVLNHNYKKAFDGRFDHESNLKKAVSMYNTGSESRGFDNGYVVKVTDNAIKQLRNVPLGAETTESVVSISVFEEEPLYKGKPLQADEVGSFKSYEKQSADKDVENNSRKRSGRIDGL